MAEKKVDFKGMSPEKKREYIWDYYRFHIIFGIIGVILVGTTVYEQMTKLTYAYNMVLLDNIVIDEPKHDAFDLELTEVALTDAKPREVASLTIFQLENVETATDAMSRTYLQKLMIQLVANEIEVLIMNEADYSHFSTQDLLSELEASKLSVNEAAYVYDETNVLTGIKLTNATQLKAVGVDTTDLILTVPTTAKSPDKIYEVMSWLFSE